MKGRSGIAAALVGALLLSACGGPEKPTISGLAPEQLRPFVSSVEREYGPADVRFRFLGGRELNQAVRGGRKADVVIAPTEVLPSANAYPGRYEIVRGVGSDRLVMIVPKRGTLVSDSFDVADDAGVSLAAARGATPLGRLTTAGLSSLRPTAQQRVQANIKRRESSAAGVIRAVRRGSVDAGLVLQSDVERHPAGLKIVFLPRRIAQARFWQAAARSGGDHDDAARAFVESMYDGKAARQLRSLGLPQGPGQRGETIPAG